MQPQPPHEDMQVDARLVAAEKRDEVAQARDLAALRRDQAAVARTLDSALAGQDRLDAARDREEAAGERLHALADREILARQLAISEIDPLTGARARAAGLIDLDHELERCRRTGGLLIVAYVDVVGLKAVNDTEGHGAGDELLKRVVGLIKANLRSYDLITRLGGDEFLCTMSNIMLPDARQRFAAVTAALAEAPGGHAIRTGFAELTSDQTAAKLIARADSELIDSRTESRRLPAAIEARAERRDRIQDPGSSGLSLTLSGGTQAPIRARAALGAFVGDIDREQLGLLELLISELVTNSVVHGGAGSEERITVQITIGPRTVHGEVSDSGPGFAPADPPTPRDIGGLGLVIVDRSTNRWGNSHGGRRVWFEMDRYSPDPGAAPLLSLA